MKKVVATALLAAAGFAASAQSQIAHWKFNGTADDAGPNAMNGVATNCTYVAGIGGAPNTAIKFNGTSSQVDVPYHPATSTAEFTIRVVLRVDDFNRQMCEGNAIFIQQSPSEYFRKTLLITDNMYNGCGAYDPAEERFQFAAHGQDPNGAAAQQYPGGITLGQWYCVTATYDGSTRKVYVDGVLKHSNPYPNQFIDDQAPISIGYFAGGIFTGYPYYLNGAIDDIALYNYAVAEADISNLCNDFKPGSETEAVGSVGAAGRPAPFPNPAGDVLNVPVQGGANADIKVCIYSLEGKLLHTETSSRKGATILQLPTASLAPGCYLVEVNDATGRSTKPFTKR